MPDTSASRLRLAALSRVAYGLLIPVFAGMAACTAPQPKASLFDRLGAMPGVTVIANETLDITSKDPRTSRSFDGINMKTLKASLAQQLCSVTGGPCKYEGETMANSHKASKITDTEFDLMVGNLRQVLDAHVGTSEKNELLRLLAPMKRDIVSG